jgi:hypothetical protein
MTSPRRTFPLSISRAKVVVPIDKERCVMAVEPYDIVVGRDDLTNARTAPAAPVVIGVDHVHVVIESYALTANNITYGLVGETMKYWRSWPSSEPAR